MGGEKRRSVSFSLGEVIQIPATSLPAELADVFSVSKAFKSGPHVCPCTNKRWENGSHCCCALGEQACSQLPWPPGNACWRGLDGETNEKKTLLSKLQGHHLCSQVGSE